MDLSDISKGQIARFASYFKGKRERSVADREAEKGDFLMDNMPDDAAIYNVEGVKQLLEAYHMQVVSRLREDLENTASVSAVFISQLMRQAEQSGFALQVEDIALIEDQSRGDQFGQLFSVIGSAPPLASRNSVGLAPMEAAGGNDSVRLMSQLEDVRQENRELKDRNMKIESEVSIAARERATVATELEQVKANFKLHLTQMHEAGGGGGPGTAECQNALVETTQSLAAKTAECDELKREISGRVGDSPQFREMKAIVKNKSAQVKELRQHLVNAGLVPPGADEGVELTADSD